MRALPPFSSAVEFAGGAESFGAIVDRLGRIAGLKAELASYEAKLKAVLLELGENAIDGEELFRATVSTFEQVKWRTASSRVVVKRR